MPEEAIAEKETAKEETPKEEVSGEGAEGGTLFTPEGVLMLSIAVILDFIGVFLFILSLLGIGIPFSFLLDIIGVGIIGGWILLRSGRITMTRKVARVFRKSLKRLGLAFLGELIPFFGDIVFCWTLVVYLELRGK